MKNNNIEKVSIIMPSNNILSPLTEISYKFSIQQDYKNLEFLIKPLEFSPKLKPLS